MLKKYKISEDVIRYFKGFYLSFLIPHEICYDFFKILEEGIDGFTLKLLQANADYKVTVKNKSNEIKLDALINDVNSDEVKNLHLKYKYNYTQIFICYCCLA